MIEDTRYISAIEKFGIDQLGNQKPVTVIFPASYVRHVQQVCLTYLVSDCPFPIQLEPRILHTAVSKAARSSIPIDIFDDILCRILEALRFEQFCRNTQERTSQ